MSGLLLSGKSFRFNRLISSSSIKLLSMRVKSEFVGKNYDEQNLKIKNSRTLLIFIVIFLALTGAFTFFLGNFFARGQADLQAFFQFHPWLYLILIPAVAMRLWAEERKSGTIELLMTLPVTTTQAVLGKFFAAWAFCGIALSLTFPIWITVNILGEPDNGTVTIKHTFNTSQSEGVVRVGKRFPGPY